MTDKKTRDFFLCLVNFSQFIEGKHPSTPRTTVLLFTFRRPKGLTVFLIRILCRIYFVIAENETLCVKEKVKTTK